MKTYTFKKGDTYQTSDYPPFDMAWGPKPKRLRKEKRYHDETDRLHHFIRAERDRYHRFRLLKKALEWAFFLASCYACCWAIYTALKTIYPGI